MKEITVTFDEKGDPTIETKGFQGGSCLTETLALEAALGKKVTDATTPEFYTTPVTTTAKATVKR